MSATTSTSRWRVQLSLRNGSPAPDFELPDPFTVYVHSDKDLSAVAALARGQAVDMSGVSNVWWRVDLMERRV